MFKYIFRAAEFSGSGINEKKLLNVNQLLSIESELVRATYAM